MTPSITVHLAFAAFLPFIALLYQYLPKRRALLVGLLAGYLFLPEYQYEIGGLPDIGKGVIVSISALIGALLFDSDRFKNFRIHWIDLIPALVVSTRLISGLYNGLGAYQGLAPLLFESAKIGIPYFLGRIYITEREGAIEAMKMIVLFALIYLPLCLWEVKMSPQLHRQVYGFHPASFAQQMRGGGFRPVVFLDHGLTVSKFMASGLICAVVLWKSNSIQQIGNITIKTAAGALLVCLLLTKTITGIGLAAVGCVGYLITRYYRVGWPYAVLLLAIPLYIVFRMNSDWAGDNIREAIVSISSEQRFQSFQTRVLNENFYKDFIGMKPLLGWGDVSWRDIELTGKKGITDSRWILLYGIGGYFGLACWYGFLIIPALKASSCFSQTGNRFNQFTPQQAICVLLLLEAVNSLFNTGLPPFIPFLVGGLTTLNNEGMADAGLEQREEAPLLLPLPEPRLV